MTYASQVGSAFAARHTLSNEKKVQKARIMEILQTFLEAHDAIKKYIKRNELDTARALLEECQQSALQIGETMVTKLHSSYGLWINTISGLRLAKS